MNAISSALRPVKRRLRIVRAVRMACWGLAVGALLCAAVLAVSFFVPIQARTAYLLVLASGMPMLLFMAGFCWPVSAAQAAQRADACGLQERVQTALALQDRQDDMARLLRRDALRSLQTLRPAAALPCRVDRLPVCMAAGLALACGMLLMLPNPQDAVLRAQRQLQQKLTAQQMNISQMQEQLENSELSAQKQQQIRKLLGDLSRELRSARTEREAMTDISRTQEQLERLLNEDKNAAMTALNEQGLNSLAQAMADQQALQQAMSAMDTQELSAALSQAAQNAGTQQASSALQQAAQAAASGDLTGASLALSQMLSDAAAAKGMNAALQGAKSALTTAAQAAGASGTQGGQGSQGSQGGQGGQGGQGQGAGTGAGQGSSNEDGGARPGSNTQKSAGTGVAQYKKGEYESIYDPTRLGDGGQIVKSTGDVTQDGDSMQVQLSPGLGSAQGDVPYDQVAGEYRDAAVQAVQEAELPDYARQWVDDYFTSLLDDQ